MQAKKKKSLHCERLLFLQNRAFFTLSFDAIFCHFMLNLCEGLIPKKSTLFYIFLCFYIILYFFNKTFVY